MKKSQKFIPESRSNRMLQRRLKKAFLAIHVIIHILEHYLYQPPSSVGKALQNHHIYLECLQYILLQLCSLHKASSTKCAKYQRECNLIILQLTLYKTHVLTTQCRLQALNQLWFIDIVSSYSGCHRGEKHISLTASSIFMVTGTIL